jgi:hypothetical protein
VTLATASTAWPAPTAGTPGTRWVCGPRRAGRSPASRERRSRSGSRAALPPAVTLAGGGAAVGWLPTAYTRLAASYDHTTLGRQLPAAEARGGARGAVAEHALIVRVQQGF